MRELRHLGIYKLAGSFMLIAVDCGEGEYVLYSRERGLGGSPLFVIAGDQRLKLSFGAETIFSTSDLEDTGENSG